MRHYTQVTEDGTIVVSGVAASCYLYEEHASLLHFTTSISNALLDVVGMTSKLCMFLKEFRCCRNAYRWPCAYRVACDVAIAEDVRLSDWRNSYALYMLVKIAVLVHSAIMQTWHVRRSQEV